MKSLIKIKQYIVLRPNISPSVATIGVAHAALAGYLKWQNEEITKSWVSGEFGPFYKVICQAKDMSEWEAVMKMENSVVIRESKLDNLAIAVVFKAAIIDKNHKYNEFSLYKG